MASHTLEARLWYTADRSRVVQDGDPEAAFLLGPAGAEIDGAEAERLGLTGKKARTAEAPAEKAVEESPDTKAVRAEQVEDKAARGPQRTKDR